MKLRKVRLDSLLVKKNLAPNLKLARSYIGAGQVRVNQIMLDKAGVSVGPSAAISVRLKRFVSRGGYKLNQAIIENKIDLVGKAVLDIGCGHGGFTDCALQAGAKKVYAIDSGLAFLNIKLLKNSKVTYIPKTNFLSITKNEISELVDFSCIDVSFISVKKILPWVIHFLKPNALAIVLIKPQFEAPRDLVEKGGVVNNKEVHAKLVDQVLEKAHDCGLDKISINPCKTRGKKKHNLEFLACLKKIG